MTSKVEHGRHIKMEMYKVDFEESELQTIETAREYPITNPQWMPYLHGFVLQLDKLKKKELLERVLDPCTTPSTDDSTDREPSPRVPSF
jgi:hypothetical protein